MSIDATASSRSDARRARTFVSPGADPIPITAETPAAAEALVQLPLAFRDVEQAPEIGVVTAGPRARPPSPPGSGGTAGTRPPPGPRRGARRARPIARRSRGRSRPARSATSRARASSTSSTSRSISSRCRPSSIAAALPIAPAPRTAIGVLTETYSGTCDRTMIRGSVISSIAKRRPSRPNPESFEPP